MSHFKFLVIIAFILMILLLFSGCGHSGSGGSPSSSSGPSSSPHDNISTYSGSGSGTGTLSNEHTTSVEYDLTKAVVTFSSVNFGTVSIPYPSGSCGTLSGDTYTATFQNSSPPILIIKNDFNGADEVNFLLTLLSAGG